MITNIFLNIETIPAQSDAIKNRILAEAAKQKAEVKAPANYKDAYKITEYITAKHAEIDASVADTLHKTSLDGARGEVWCISWAVDDEPVQNISRVTPDDNAEADILDFFFKTVLIYEEPRFVGHNVRDFDLRFLYHRAVILGVNPGFHIPHDVRYNGAEVFDTMTGWAGWGNRISLARLCEALGLDPNGTEIGQEIDGSKVWEFVQAGRVDEVARYCDADVERVRTAYERMTFCG